MPELASKSVQANSRRPIAGTTLFFPAATVYAIFVLPASVLSMSGIASGIPGLASVVGHAHEMLFGFALVVVAGNQLGAMAGERLAAVFGLWVVARSTFLLSPQSAAAAAANIAFAAILAAHIAPRLSGAAKKWRNQALPVVLMAICGSGIAFQIAHYVGYASVEYSILTIAVLLFALLMLFMGGRMLAPAAAGQFYRQGGKLDARVQPRIESGLILAMAVAAVAAAFAGEPSLAGVSAIAMVAARLFAAVRLLRWRLWALRGRADLLCLGAGCGWLALGLLLFGASVAADRYQTAALHAITVGGLGTLTLNVMALTWLQRARQAPSRARIQVWGTLLIAVATLARALAGLGVFDPQQLLLLASLCRIGAFGLLLALLIGVRARPPRTVEPGA